MAIMTLADWVGVIVTHVTNLAYYHDVREMQNVASDDVTFPAAFFEEYYTLRNVKNYGWTREYTIELHWLDLCEMQNESAEREQIRERLTLQAESFVDELNRLTGNSVKDFTCDAEPPMFDANAVGILMRVTFSIKQCTIFTNPYEAQQ